MLRKPRGNVDERLHQKVRRRRKKAPPTAAKAPTGLDIGQMSVDALNRAALKAAAEAREKKKPAESEPDDVIGTRRQ